MENAGTEGRIQNPGHSSKSLQEIITEGLGVENKEALDRLVVNVRAMLRSGADYIEENPAEAVAVAVGVGLGAYLALATKPGRRAVEFTALAFMPKIRVWVMDLFKENGGKAGPAPEVHH